MASSWSIKKLYPVLNLSARFVEQGHRGLGVVTSLDLAG